MKIKNNFGELVEFDITKLESSLRNSGAAPESIKKVLELITPKCFDGITTRELYKMAFEALKELSRSVAARYSLKRALSELGPAGFYFEQWISRVFQALGYQTMTGQHIKGHAVTHEADVIAKKGDRTYWMECKFRNTDDAKISVTTPMYVLSRIKDISGIDYKLFGATTQFTDGWLVTNAYFTSDSTTFAEYYKLKMLSWDYPQNRGLKNLVDANVLYPVTCLTTINEVEKSKLLESGCILVKEFVENPKFLNLLNLKPEQQELMLQEAKELLVNKISE
ncbi:restriction endonuclease [Soonwooa sp.]|uniref:restriction endonuclease n=1 Tax=Soonwooa sp. TaxID=1938592 RepID=UPI00262322A4|nr:restriction endonuclease [Soonwooa sp.]